MALFGRGGSAGDLVRDMLGIVPRPRELPSYSVPGPRSIYGAGTPQATVMPGDQPVPVTVGAPQEDPLDRFERIARLMDIGERVGAGFMGGDVNVETAGGGVAHPLLPNPQNYGIRLLR